MIRVTESRSFAGPVADPIAAISCQRTGEAGGPRTGRTLFEAQLCDHSAGRPLALKCSPRALLLAGGGGTDQEFGAKPGRAVIPRRRRRMTA